MIFKRQAVRRLTVQCVADNLAKLITENYSLWKRVREEKLKTIFFFFFFSCLSWNRKKKIIEWKVIPHTLRRFINTLDSRAQTIIKTENIHQVKSQWLRVKQLWMTKSTMMSNSWSSCVWRSRDSGIGSWRRRNHHRTSHFQRYNFSMKITRRFLPRQPTPDLLLVLSSPNLRRFPKLRHWNRWEPKTASR